MSSDSHNVDNFYRACHVVLDNIPTMLRELLLRKLLLLGWFTNAGGDNPLVFPALGSSLKSSGVKPKFSKDNEHVRKLFAGEVDKWDTTLLAYLLINEKTLALYSSGTKEYEAVRKLKDVRNEKFGHLPEAKMSDSDLRNMIDDVKRCYDDLSAELSNLEGQTTGLPSIIPVDERSTFTEVLKTHLEDIWKNKIESKVAEELLKEVQKEFDNLHKEDHKNKEQIKCLEQIIHLLQKEIYLMKEDIDTTKEDVSVLNETVEGLKKDVKQLKENESKELTALNAFKLLKECKFGIYNNWANLARTLEVPLAERKRLHQNAILLHDGRYDQALEESLEYWIKSGENPTWDTLISAVRDLEKNTANDMERKLHEGIVLSFT